jgi:branched-chain amino acid transport system ATP-binding protein
MSLLEVNGLNSYYGDSHILFDISLRVERNEVVALLGRNGAGKSTTLKNLMGVVTPHAGSIVFDGAEIAGKKSHTIAQAGMQLVHEDRRIFGSLNVEENLVLAGLTARNRWPLDRIYEMFPRLKDRRGSRGTDLSGGEQQMLAIGRALMTNPSLLILDEATEGLAPLLREEIWRTLAELRRSGLAILVIDKYVDRLVMLAERHTILERGRVAWTGASAELAVDRGLWERYLGV